MKKLLFVLIILCTTLTTTKAQIGIDDFEGGENEYLFNGRTLLIKTSIGYVSNLSIPKELTNEFYSISSMQPSYSISIDKPLLALTLPKSYYISYNVNFSYLRQLITLHNQELVKNYGLDENTSPVSVFNVGIGLSLHKNFSKKLESYINVGYNYLFYGSEETGFSAIPSDADRRQVSALLGVRYGLNNLFSLFAEGGYDVQYLKVGLALSF